MSAAAARTERRAVLEQLVLETVRQYATLWETTQYARALVERIDHAKLGCADSAGEQQALVDEYTQRAWARLEQQRAVRPGSRASGRG